MKNTLKLLVIALISAFIALGSVRFLTDTSIYIKHTLLIKEIENEADSGHWTEEGLITWTVELIDAYEKAVVKKMDFIESSDVATYLYYSGFSITGKLFRFISILEVIALLYLSINFLWNSLKLLFRRFVRFLKKLVHRLTKRHK